MSRSISKLISPKAKDIGSFSVRRAIPQVGTKSVGPWVFFDHFGPVDMPPGDGMDVRPHPHINLATVTYLFSGEIFHRDSLSNALAIRPGAVNLMVAGKGITHSERTRDAMRASGQTLHGLQLWMALPTDYEEIDPAFYHYPGADIEGCSVRVMMGHAYGLSSPVKTYSPTLYMEADMPGGASLDLPDAQELAVYVVHGQAQIGDQVINMNSMAVLDDAQTGTITANGETRLAIIGGAPLGKRFMEWNFVSSRKARIDQAKADWREGRFDKVPGDDEFIPLPE